MLKKLILTAFTVFFITACGGGGGSAAAPDVSGITGVTTTSGVAVVTTKN